MRLRAFQGENVGGAAALLAERHARHRAGEPLLAPLEDAQAEVERTWRAVGASGAVALDGGEVVGYLLGSVRENEYWHKHVWVELAGHAAREPELVRDLYRLAAERWVEEGAALHVALVPALPELLEPWFRLAFAHMQAHAIRESGETARPLPAGLAIRAGTRDDLEAARPLLPLIWQHHREPPTFTGIRLPPADEYLADWEETLEEEANIYFVAELGGAIVGHVLLNPEEPDLARPPGSVYLAVAASLPQVRGRGVGVALTDHALGWAREAGYRTVHTDWRVANLESSRFWPRRGFRETFYRLARRVGIG